MKSCCVLQDHDDDERDKTMFHNTTPDLQDQDQNQDHIVYNTKTKTAACKTKTKTDFFGSQTGLVLRPTVSDHITDSSYIGHYRPFQKAVSYILAPRY